jgi:hypothetical protein
MRKQTNTPSPSPKGFQSPSPRTSEKSADSDSDVRKALVNTGKFSPFTENLILPVNEILYQTIITINKNPYLSVIRSQCRRTEKLTTIHEKTDLAFRSCNTFFQTGFFGEFNKGRTFGMIKEDSFKLFFLVLGAKYCNNVQFHHAFSILHHCMHHCPAVLPGSLVRQPWSAALPGSLARQPCPAALPGSLARQPCPAAFQKRYKINIRP